MNWVDKAVTLTIFYIQLFFINLMDLVILTNDGIRTNDFIVVTQCETATALIHRQRT